MKKLMIAAVAVACAMVASAASFDWKTNMGQQIYQSGSTTTKISGTAYIFSNAGTTTQLAVLQNFYDTGKMLTGSLDSKSVSSGSIAATAGEAFNWGSAGDTLNAYIAVISGNEIYISAVVSGLAPETGYTQLKYDAKASSQMAATTLTGKPSMFGGAGWYTKGTEPEPTPEPTSAMLMLLGVAGLALRRKQK